MKEYKKIFRFVKPHMGLFALGTVCMMFSAIFDGVSISMLMPLADKVLTKGEIVIPGKVPPSVSNVVSILNNAPPKTLLNFLIAAVLILFVLKGIFNFLQSYLLNDLSFRVTRDLRAKLYAKLNTLSLDYFTHRRGGELMSRITNDVGMIGNAISYGAIDLVYQSLQVVVFAAMIVVLYKRLAFFALILLPLVSFPIVKVGKFLKKVSRKTQERMADINSVLFESIIGARVVKAFNAETYEQTKFNESNNAYYKLSLSGAKRTYILSPVMELIAVFAGVVIIRVEGQRVIDGQISFGVLAVSIFALFSMLRPFKKLSAVHSIFQQAFAGSRRVYEVLDTVPSVRDKANAVAMTGFRENIVFEDVWFGYGLQEVLKGIDLQVKRGQVLAVVGPSGAGKTTLLDLIPRFYDPSKGRVMIDGKDIREYSIRSLRQNISIVTQETILFNDTVYNNIAYGMETVRREQVEEAARQAHVHDVIVKLEKGYDTFIGDRGVKLSGGERQRVAIARALIKGAPILILDEATSQLDTESERLVQEALNGLMKGKTVFVIAHRLSTVRDADRIVVIDAGRIVEQGTHGELLALGNLYHRLYNNQLSQGGVAA